MKALLLAVFVGYFAFPALATEQMTATQHIENAKSSPTLRAWGKKERERLTPQNPGYRMNGPKDLCAVMRSVGFGCSFNERGELVQYLFAQGVDLFPCEGGTNPYTRDMCGKMDADKRADSFYNYVGQPVQNAMLKKSIEKNQTLFRNGDLTASNAGKWKK